MAGNLRREIGLSGAVLLGLGSIVGTGVFVSLGFAIELLGGQVITAIACAAALALCNGLSSAQLAAQHPVSGGTYEYGYRWLGPWWGFTAGWVFLWAKSASAAAAALGLANYLLPFVGNRTGAVRLTLAYGALASVCLGILWGIKRTNRLNAVIVAVTLLSLLAFVLLGIPSAWEHQRWNEPLVPAVGGPTGWGAFWQATALMFVAFTGYGRLATLGEEVREPSKTIPRAILLTLLGAMLLYMGVALVAVGVLGPAEVGWATRGTVGPLRMVAAQFPVRGAEQVVAVGAITAMLGVLLNLVLGLSRVVLAMGRRADLPIGLAQINAVTGNPDRATGLVAAMVGGLVAWGDIHAAWSLSAFTVLIYYALTNVCALRLTASERLYPRPFAWIGLGGCVSLAFWVEPRVWLSGLGLLSCGWLGFAVKERWARHW